MTCHSTWSVTRLLCWITSALLPMASTRSRSLTPRWHLSHHSYDTLSWWCWWWWWWKTFVNNFATEFEAQQVILVLWMNQKIASVCYHLCLGIGNRDCWCNGCSIASFRSLLVDEEIMSTSDWFLSFASEMESGHSKVLHQWVLGIEGTIEARLAWKAAIKLK